MEEQIEAEVTQTTLSSNRNIPSFDEEIVASTALPASDSSGHPVPVTIPISLGNGISVVYSTRLGGVSVGDCASLNLGGKGGDNPVHVQANRRSFAKELNATLSLVNQVHSATVVNIDELVQPQGAQVVSLECEADAQITSKTGIALGIFAADCLPVLLADPRKGIIAGAHCGRKGLQHGVLENTLEAMKAQGAEPVDIIATLGPCICGDCYEVGGDIADDFDAQFPGTFTLTRFGGPGINLAQAAVQVLLRFGIREEHIISSRPRVSAATQYLDHDAELESLCAQDGEGSSNLGERIEQIRHPMCSFENPLWYSHRRAALAHKSDEGRLLACIMRV